MADVTFTGNLTAAPEMKFSNAGKPFANFTVAENYRKRNQSGEWKTRVQHSGESQCSDTRPKQ